MPIRHPNRLTGRLCFESYAEAAGAMGIARRNVQRLASRGQLEVIRPMGAGPGKPCLVPIDQDEVQKRMG